MNKIVLAQQMHQPVTDEPALLKARQDFATNEATRNGLVAMFKTAVVWVPCNILLMKFSPFYNQRFSVSAKTAFLISPPMMMFAFVAESTTTRLSNPDAFRRAVSEKDLKARPSQLYLYQQIANSFLDHPFQWLAAIGTPAVIGIFGMKSQDKEITFSQRIMHTRVIGQFTVLMTLAGTMMLHDYMQRRGRFLEPWEEEILAKKGVQ